MKEYRAKVNPEGNVRFTKDYENHLFLARPKGIINPSLLDEDLEQASEFSLKCEKPWTYCTNTEEVKLVNPFNIFYLKEIKKLRNLKEIVIYAPGAINRFLIKMASPIIKPDRIIASKEEFETFLKLKKKASSLRFFDTHSYIRQE